LSKNTYKERVNKLARSFEEHGRTPDNIKIYQQSNDAFMELTGAHTSNIAKLNWATNVPQNLCKGEHNYYCTSTFWTASTNAAHLHHQSKDGQQH
jgi:hypothetical protein